MTTKTCSCISYTPVTYCFKEIYNFTCLGYIPTSLGNAKEFILEITDIANEKTKTVAVTPSEILSHTSMKRILLHENIIYMPTSKEHEQMLSHIFSIPPNVILSHTMGSNE